MPPEPHPRYQLLDKIASGSFATVYRGRDLELGREVAIKQIHDQFLADPQQLDRYWAEAQLLASFQHPNIVTIYDIVRERGWLILELMQSDLAKVAGRKQMDLGALRTTLAHCLRALKFLHAHGIVHGDIKPSNMMIDRRRRVKIGDFGLARRVSNEQGSLIKGTTKYMAPEVVSDEFGEVVPASDLYSLGFAAYELMFGENFESLFPGLNAFGRDRQMAWMMWHAAPDRRLPDIARVLADVPEDLARTIQKLTAKPQSQRYRSADEALSDLNIDLKIVKTGEESADNLGRPAAAAAGPDGRRRMLLIAAVAVSLLSTLAILFMPDGSGTTVVDKPKPIVGIVRQVLAGEDKLVIEDEAGVPTEFEAGKQPRVRLDEGQYILLRELAPGDRVEIRVEQAGDRRTVNVAALRPVEGTGKLKEVDPERTRLTATLAADPQPQDVPMFVPGGAKLFLNGNPATLQELQAGDRISVAHLKDTQGRAARDVIRLDALRTMQLTAFCKEVAARNDSLWLVVERFGNAAQFEFADDCRITINGRPGSEGARFTPRDLAPGDRLQVSHDVRVTGVDAVRRERHTGVLMKVDQSSREVQVRSDEGREETFAVGDDCQIYLEGKLAHLDDLMKFDRLDVTYDAREGAPPAARTIDARHPLQ